MNATAGMVDDGDRASAAETIPCGLGGRNRVGAGHSKDRCAYAPIGGVFQTALDLGATIESGQAIGAVDGRPVLAKVGGILRGIVKNGLTVPAAAKLADIDPRGDARALTRISEKAWILAAAVHRVLRVRGILPRTWAADSENT